MLKTKTLDALISQYYDDEMNESELMNYEARIAVSRNIREYTNEQCFEFFKISNSIKLAKNRANKKSQSLIDNIKIREQKSLFFYFNSIAFKSINKRLRNLFLNTWRNNTK